MYATKSLTSGETSTPSVALAVAVRRPLGFAAQATDHAFPLAVTAGLGRHDARDGSQYDVVAQRKFGLQWEYPAPPAVVRAIGQRQPR
jgi:hypothetical protein